MMPPAGNRSFDREADKEAWQLHRLRLPLQVLAPLPLNSCFIYEEVSCI